MWDLTLRQFVALRERWEAEQRAADHRAGQIAVMLYNVHRDRAKDPRGATWMDFFPQWKEDRGGPQTDEQMFDAMMIWARVTAKERA